MTSLQALLKVVIYEKKRRDQIENESNTETTDSSDYSTSTTESDESSDELKSQQGSGQEEEEEQEEDFETRINLIIVGKRARPQTKRLFDEINDRIDVSPTLDEHSVCPGYTRDRKRCKQWTRLTKDGYCHHHTNQKEKEKEKENDN